MSGAGQARILIVDDEAVNLRLMEALLRPENYDTYCAGGGAEAFEVIARHKPDLILLDVMMPGMDGYQVATRLKANPDTANIPIIMLTALMERDARMEGLSAGASEFLTKPVDRAELYLRVRNLLRMKSFGDFLIGQSWVLEQTVRTRTAELQRFRSAMDATAEAIMLVQRSSMQFIEVNHTACKLLGYTRAELLAIGPAQVGMMAPEDLAIFYDALIEGKSNKNISEMDVRRKDGALVAVEVQRQAHLFDEDTIPMVADDIIDLCQARHFRPASESRLV